MTKFQTIVSLFTVINGLILADLFGSLHKLIKARKLVKWHWFPLLFSWNMFLYIINNWWAFTSPPKDPEEYNILHFLAYAHVEILYYLIISAALPDKIGKKGIDLKEYYYANHKYLWSLMTAILMSLQLINIIKAIEKSDPINTPNLIANIMFILFAILLILYKKYWLHATILVIYTLGAFSNISNHLFD